MPERTRIDIGAYGVSEASRFARVPVTTARRWIRGYGGERYAPVFRPDLPPVNGRFALSFLDLVDLLVVGRFRDAGVPLQTVRKAYSWLARTLDTDHPFAHGRLLTDGSTVFLEMIEHGRSEGDAEEAERLIEVVSGQVAMPRILRPYLKQIDYEPQTRQAWRWRISEGVVLDPRMSFGKPTLEEVGTTTFVLSRAYWANEQNESLVADLFDVSPEAVLRAVHFEHEYQGHRAA